MTRDELGRVAQLLDQGVDIDRETVRKLLAYAIRDLNPREHRQGCGWWRGETCTMGCGEQLLLTDGTGPVEPYNGGGGSLL